MLMIDPKLVDKVNIPELVKALRCCAENFGCPIECPRYSPADEGVRACVSRLEKDAAAAIEDLQAELEKKRMADCWGCKCEKVEPKRGEWIVKGANRIDCSVCGHSVCFAFGLSDGSFDLYKYCPECGAKMEVQE